MASTHGGFAVKPVRSTMQLVGMVNGIVAAVLFGVSLILLLISFYVSDYPGAVLGLRIASGGVAFGGIVELIIAAAFRRIARKVADRLASLKAIGIAYPATITNIINNNTVITGYSRSVYAECIYTNKEGKTCLVESKSFMHAYAANNDNYTATVYVDAYNPHDYAVEIFTTINTARADYDYR